MMDKVINLNPESLTRFVRLSFHTINRDNRTAAMTEFMGHIVFPGTSISHSSMLPESVEAARLLGDHLTLAFTLDILRPQHMIR